MENRVTRITIAADAKAETALALMKFLYAKGIRIEVSDAQGGRFFLEDLKGCPVVLENDLREEVRNLPGVVALETLPTGLGREAVWKGY